MEASRRDTSNVKNSFIKIILVFVLILIILLISYFVVKRENYSEIKQTKKENATSTNKTNKTLNSRWSFTKNNTLNIGTNAESNKETSLKTNKTIGSRWSFTKNSTRNIATNVESNKEAILKTNKTLDSRWSSTKNNKETTLKANKTLDSRWSFTKNDTGNIVTNVESNKETSLKTNRTLDSRWSFTKSDTRNIVTKVESNKETTLKTNTTINSLQSRMENITQKPKSQSKKQNNLATMNKTINEGRMFIFQQGDFCLDTVNHIKNSTIGMYKCHNHDHDQEWELTTKGELKNRKSCVTLINSTSAVIIDLCNGTTKQQWRFSAGVFRNPEYNVCIETKGIKIFAAKCKATIKKQKFKSKLIHVIDRVCTLKKGSYAFKSDDKWIITSTGYMLHNKQCLTYNKGSLSYSKKLCSNLNTQKWEYTEDGQIKNSFENVCVGKGRYNIEIYQCNLNLESQRWICA